MKDKIIFGIILIVIIILMVLSGFGIWKASSFLFEEATVSESKEKTEKIVNKPLNKIENWKHPDFFEFKNFKEFRLTDTLHIDLNGNGILEKVYFENTTCSKIIIKEEGEQIQISLGCRKQNYKEFPDTLDWVNLWWIVSDKETFEVLVKEVELIRNKIVNLERPCLYIGEEEFGGGIITYKKEELHWIHQPK